VDRPHLAVVIPAYNEEPRIERSLERVREYLSGQGYSWSVLVVSDGSTDATPDIAARFASNDPRFAVNAYTPNQGKGCAVRTGMIEAEADWLLLCDADLAAPIEEVEKLFAAGKPVAIGSRPLRESKLEVRQPWWRELAGRAFNAAVQLLAIRGIKDTQCGFKLFRRDAAKEIFPRCRLNGYGYDFEALMLAQRLGHEIAEVPIRWAHQEGSKVRLLRDGLRMLRDLVLLRLTFRSRLVGIPKTSNNAG
jgi:dolichyl-phosphate beta-glucosyltransferase